MKRGFKQITIFLSMILLLGMVFAANNTQNQTSTSTGQGAQLDSTTEKEVALMVDNYGAQIRVLQLQRAINRMILQAQAIIDVLKNKSKNTSTLESILEEMKIVLEDAKKIDPSSETAVEDFVNVKEDAIALRKEFHDELKGLLTKEDKEQLRKRFREMDRKQLKQLTDQIKDLRRKVNANRIRRMARLTGINAEEYAKKVESGEINATEAIKILRKRYASLSPSKRKEIRKKLRENLTKEQKTRIRKLIQAREKRLKQAELRAQKRAEYLKKKGFNIPVERLKKRAELFKARSTNLNQLANKLQNQFQK